MGGSGTASDPYIIADWEIKASGLFASIYIVNTNAHFVRGHALKEVFDVFEPQKPPSAIKPLIENEKYLSGYA